jgi:hypothetical protein
MSSSFPPGPSSDRPSDRPLYTDEELVLQPHYQRRTMYGGDTFIFDIQIQRPPAGSPPGTPPQPVNLTGYFIWFSAKYHAVDPDNQAVSFLTTALSGGIVVTDALNGKVEITMPAIATRSFPSGVTPLITTVKVKDTSGNVFTAEVAVLEVWPSGVAAIS